MITSLWFPSENITLVSLSMQAVVSVCNRHIQSCFQTSVSAPPFEYLVKLDVSSCEYYKTANWIHAICELPIGKYKYLPINPCTLKHEIKDFLRNNKLTMDSSFGERRAPNTPCFHLVRDAALQWCSCSCRLSVRAAPQRAATHSCASRRQSPHPLSSPPAMLLATSPLPKPLA